MSNKTILRKIRMLEKAFTAPHNEEDQEIMALLKEYNELTKDLTFDEKRIIEERAADEYVRRLEH